MFFSKRHKYIRVPRRETVTCGVCGGRATAGECQFVNLGVSPLLPVPLHTFVHADASVCARVLVSEHGPAQRVIRDEAERAALVDEVGRLRRQMREMIEALGPDSVRSDRRPHHVIADYRLQIDDLKNQIDWALQWLKNGGELLQNKVKPATEVEEAAMKSHLAIRSLDEELNRVQIKMQELKDVLQDLVDCSPHISRYAKIYGAACNEHFEDEKDPAECKDCRTDEVINHVLGVLDPRTEGSGHEPERG